MLQPITRQRKKPGRTPPNPPLKITHTRSRQTHGHSNNNNNNNKKNRLAYRSPLVGGIGLLRKTGFARFLAALALGTDLDDPLVLVILSVWAKARTVGKGSAGDAGGADGK